MTTSDLVATVLDDSGNAGFTVAHRLREKRSLFEGGLAPRERDKFRDFVRMGLENLSLLLSRRNEQGLFQRFGNSEADSLPSILWNSAFILDTLTRSAVARTFYREALDDSRVALFELPDLKAATAERSPKSLSSRPRSVPHLAALSVRTHTDSAGPAASWKDLASAQFDQLFYEAHYIVLQLLRSLTSITCATAADDKGRLPLVDVARRVALVVANNGGFFCNEQFDPKHSILALLVAIEAEGVIAAAPWHETTVGKTLQSVLLTTRTKISLATFDGVDKLRTFTTETEYLLYLIMAVGLLKRSDDSLRVRSFIVSLCDDLLARQSSDGLLVSTSGRLRFDFLLALHLLAVERILL